jgi:hypothetical protein
MMDVRQSGPGPHTALDQAEGVSHGWAAQAAQLQAQLVPSGLDPAPLATVERLVKAHKGQRRRRKR